MLPRLIPYYTQPESLPYRNALFLQRYLWVSLIGVIATILIYPLGKTLYYHSHLTSLQADLNHWQTTAQHNRQQIDLLTPSPTADPAQDQQLAQFMAEIDRLLSYYHMNIDNVQWQFSAPKRVSMIVSQQTQPILQLLADLNRLQAVEISHLNLTKLPNQQVQLTITLLLSQRTAP